MCLPQCRHLYSYQDISPKSSLLHTDQGIPAVTKLTKTETTESQKDNIRVCIVLKKKLILFAAFHNYFSI